MKRIILASLFLFFCSTSFAQELLPVEEFIKVMSKGGNPAFTVEIPQATLKDVIKEWDKYIKAGSKEQSYDAGGEHVQPGAVNKNVAPVPFKIYSTQLETSTGVRVNAWFSLGNDSVFISSEMDKDRALAAKKYMRDFALMSYRNVVKKELEDEKAKKKKLDSELKDLVKQEEKSGKNISEAQRSIARAQDAIATSRGDEQRKNDMIYNQKSLIEGMSNKNDQSYKDAEKVLKGLEKEKEKLQKESEKQNGKIDDWNRDIREEKRKIDDLRQDQRIKRSQIEDQKRTMLQVEAKLKGIK